MNLDEYKIYPFTPKFLEDEATLAGRDGEEFLSSLLKSVVSIEISLKLSSFSPFIFLLDVFTDVLDFTISPASFASVVKILPLKSSRF